MRLVFVAGVLAACSSSKSTVDAPSAPRQQLASLDDGQISKLVLTAYGNEILTMRNLEDFASQTARPDGCPNISVNGNVITIAATNICERTNPAPVNFNQIFVSGSATITSSHTWPGQTPDPSASTVYTSSGLEFFAMSHVFAESFGRLDGSLEVSPTGLWTGDLAYHPDPNSPPPPIAIHVQWTCDTTTTHCDPAGTEIVWNGAGSMIVTGSLQFGSSLQQEQGEIHLQADDRLDATWSGGPSAPISWSIGGRSGSVYADSPISMGYDWNN